MEVSSLGNFAAAPKQTSELSSNEGSKNASAASQPQATATEGAQTSPIPPVNETGDAAGGNTVNPESSSGSAVDLLA
jgi:hypothetical protein